MCCGVGLLNTGRGGGQWEATSRTVTLPHESETEKSLPEWLLFPAPPDVFTLPSYAPIEFSTFEYSPIGSFFHLFQAVLLLKRNYFGKLSEMIQWRGEMAMLFYTLHTGKARADFQDSLQK